MASQLRQLNDEDLDAIHHMIRRDALTDLQIAHVAEKKLGRPLGRTDHAKAMVIHRYRNSKTFKKWADQWSRRWVEVEKEVRLQQQKLEAISSFVRKDSEEGIEDLSNYVLGRLLVMAAEMSDEDLQAAASGKFGWITKVVKAHADLQKAGGNIETEIENLDNAKLTPEQKQAKLREIFGF